jgi:hypothetical protein
VASGVIGLALSLILTSYHGDITEESMANRPAGRALTRTERGRAGIMARLGSEDWSAMTAAARKSPDHVAGMDRWVRIAREQNPALDDRQAERMGEHLRREHYRKMGRLSAQSRKAKAARGAA